VRLGAGPSSATLVNLHIVRRVALSQANIWSRKRAFAITTFVGSGFAERERGIQDTGPRS
jgi:hypothetical protein